MVVLILHAVVARKLTDEKTWRGRGDGGLGGVGGRDLDSRRCRLGLYERLGQRHAWKNGGLGGGVCLGDADVGGCHRLRCCDNVRVSLDRRLGNGRGGLDNLGWCCYVAFAGGGDGSRGEEL